MPSYRMQLSEAQLASLVQYLEGLPALPGATASRATGGQGATIDPVCGMQVHPEPDTPHLTHEGRTVYFCSESCRDRFAARPGEFRN